MKRTVLATLVSVLYAVSGFLLYRQRRIVGGAPWSSDLLVFHLPIMLAFLAFLWVFWPSPGRNGFMAALGRALALARAGAMTAVSFYAYAFLAFHLYGT